MSKAVTLIFPGQGSQYVGMGKLLEGCESFAMLEKADQVLGYSLSKIMLEGPEDELKMTQNTQPAILTHSLMLCEELKKLLTKNNITIERVLGHSVGEYAALVAAGAVSFEDAIQLVHLRGKFMQDAVPVGRGAMYALLKVPQDIILKACQAVSTEQEKVMPANFNEPSQIVISGDKNACERALKWLEENHKDAYRAVELNVSAPFHSSLMAPAAQNMLKELEKTKINNTHLPYIANIDAQEYAVGTKASTVIQNLYKQVDGAVLWTQSIAKLSDGSVCLEVGPGRVLMGLVRKINRNIKVIPMDKENPWDEIEKEILSACQ